MFFIKYRCAAWRSQNIVFWGLHGALYWGNVTWGNSWRRMSGVWRVVWGGNGYRILVGESSVTLKWILKKLDWRGRLDLSDLRYWQLGGGGHFWTRLWRIQFHKLRLMFWVAVELSASEGRFCFTEWLNCMYSIFALKYCLLTQYVIKCKANQFFTVLYLNNLEFWIPSAVTLFVTHAGLSLIKQLNNNYYIRNFAADCSH